MQQFKETSLKYAHHYFFKPDINYFHSEIDIDITINILIFVVKKYKY